MIYSKWYYGHIVTSDNNYIDFDEGSGEVSVTLRNGSYTLEEFAEEIATQMTVGSLLPQTYTANVSRETRQITIVSDTSNFELLVTSGSHVGASAYALAGYTGADRTGAQSYTGNLGSGDSFEAQFPLQSLTDFSEQKQYLDSSVNVAASGYVEVVSFGAVRYLDCDIKFQTNTPQKRLIMNDPQGFENLKAFMEYAVQKGRMEFMLDSSAPDTYVKCILESTPDSSDGTGYKVKRMIGQNLYDYYETGGLRFREVF